MTDTQDLIAQLRLGASISRDRNLNLDFAKVADEAAEALEAAQAEIERLRAVVQANHEWHQNHDDHDGYPESELCEMNTAAGAPPICKKCRGSGLVPVCCGNFTTGAEYMGQVEDGLCCGSPDTDGCDCGAKVAV